MITDNKLKKKLDNKKKLDHNIYNNNSYNKNYKDKKKRNK
jgi:hypothetical protein